MSEKKEQSEMRKRFNKRGFGVTSYSRAYGVSSSVLSQVLDGILHGSKERQNGKVRVIMNQLKKDGVIRGKLVWEK